MGLLVDISVVADSIVKAAWARAVANRERLRRRLDVQAVREAAAADRSINAINGKSIPGAAGWEQLYTTPTPLKYKPEDPVGYPVKALGEDYPLAIFYSDGFSGATISVVSRFRIMTTDQSTSINYLLPDPYDYLLPIFPAWADGGVDGGAASVLGRTPCLFASRNLTTVLSSLQYSFRQDFSWLWSADDFFILPVGPASCIICIWEKWARGLYSVESIYTRPVPSGPYLDIDTTVLDLSYDSLIEFSTCFLVTPSSIREVSMPGGIQAILNSRNRNPTWNPITTGATLPAQIVDNDFTVAPVSGDVRSGVGAQGDPFGAGVYEVLGQPPPPSTPTVKLRPLSGGGGFIEYKSTSDDPVTETSIFRRNNAGRISYPGPYPFDSAGVYGAWDWGLADYCRAQLLALGFSSGDLEP